MSRVKCHSDGIATAEVDDVPVLEEPLVDLLIVDVRSIRGIPVDQEHLAVDRNDLGVKARHLRIFQYDLTNRRLPPDPDARSAEAELLASARAIEDRELAEHRL